MNKKIIRYINVQNKTGVGGVERIVVDFTTELISQGIPNETFNLARSKYSRELLSISNGRKILIILRAIELTLLILIRRIMNYKENLVIIFYHSECHLLLNLISRFIKILPGVTTVVYLCQSVDIYPAKLISSCFSAISKSNLTICYSSLVARQWQDGTRKQIYSIYSPVSLERLEVLNSRSAHTSLNLIHIGRPVSFKQPERSLYFAIKVSEICETVKLTFVGIENLNIMSQISIPKNLEVEFKGIVQDTISITREATALLNLVDFNKSREVIGVAAIESLCLGVPVVIHALDQTGYSELPGILTEEEFIEKLIQYPPQIMDYSRIFSLDKERIEEVRNKVSSKNFLRELQKLLIANA